MRVLRLMLLAAFGVPPLTAQPPNRPTVEFGAFADLYYAYDFGKPVTFDRYYTTQPARHNEFNVNLAFVEAVVARRRVHGRLALQAGTSVQSNYAAEPENGTVSGDDLSRHIQEAWAGIRLAEGLWLDGGIYFSHIGLESWISRDNLTYTRSISAEFTPYYQAGARLSWAATSALALQLHLVNGWQNVAESNGDKAAGFRADWTVTEHVVLAYANFLGREGPVGEDAGFRGFHQLMAKFSTGSLEAALTGDLGTQSRPGGDATWWSATLVGRYRVSDRVAVNGRLERYSDPDGAIVATGLPDAFETTGASFGLDLILPEGVLWRTELRGFRGDGPIYPDAGEPPRRDGGFVVTSLALTL